MGVLRKNTLWSLGQNGMQFRKTGEMQCRKTNDHTYDVSGALNEINSWEDFRFNSQGTLKSTSNTKEV